ncbi:hypothetical protein NPJ88_003645 [Halomonas elongata]|uniref:hypothetical protein n=1 Tax=Halomonas elongata TaxID=2746 RepID=UPI00255AB3A9|nr:hypothetical protein [Halomonas elongata]MDL4861419.1 hypothetical protein [Halomonas elongata]
MTTMTTTPSNRYRDQLIDETNRLQRERTELAVTGPMLALIDPWDDDARVRINGRRHMHQFFADHYQHELEQLEGAA